MQRKQVLTHLNLAGAGCHKAVWVEARCKNCRCFKRSEMLHDDKVLPLARGGCLLNPKVVNKHVDDWCWQFQPVVRD